MNTTLWFSRMPGLLVALAFFLSPARSWPQDADDPGAINRAVRVRDSLDELELDLRAYELTQHGLFGRLRQAPG